ncbi:MAG: carboxypeptidase M32 [Anaerolineae bacterium]|nr:carboxypeptidase M32 [Anaerolineae bacterium]
MEEKLRALKDELAVYMDLYYASAVLGWDQETNMPPGGAQARADQGATLSELAHRRITDDKVGRLLDDLKAYEESLDYDSDDASLIRITRREYEKRVKVPAELVAEIARAGALGIEAWKEARTKSEFSLFESALQKLIDLKMQYAECFAPYENIYDPLLDEFEPGVDYAQISAVFAGLKPELVKLVAAIGENLDAVDDGPVRGEFTDESQMAFGRIIAKDLGFDFERGRLDLSAHPFTTGFSHDDVRITTRTLQDFLPSCLMSIIHETGHALYEQGSNPAYYRTILAGGASMAIHESQSRFWENIIGRSRPFWEHYHPLLIEHFPQLEGVDRETFYRAINKSYPSFIRVEADEVTYGLHIILRFELENDLFNGRVKVGELPDVWNARFEEYLGIVPPDDAMGVLQDVHWSQALFGYFPDYLLGSIFSVQLWNKLKEELPGAVDQVRAGKFDEILGWHRQKVHRHGTKFTLPELSERAVGGPLDWQPYMNYLNAKFGELYGL